MLKLWILNLQGLISILQMALEKHQKLSYKPIMVVILVSIYRSQKAPIHSYTDIDSAGVPFLCHLQHRFLAHCGCLQQTYTNPAFHEHHSHSPLLRMHYQEYLAPARITKFINVHNYLIQLPTGCKHRV